MQLLNKLAPAQTAADDDLGGMRYDAEEVPREVLIVRDSKNGPTRDIAVTPPRVDKSLAATAAASLLTGKRTLIRIEDVAAFVHGPLARDDWNLFAERQAAWPL